jgi:histidyl-tRNA synthetase
MSGAGSDVVQKEMYTFSDRSDRSLTLRPEGTAPICRAYVEHGMHRDPQPVKLFTIASMYRYGAPGRGRYREHWQASVEALGTDDPAIDAELIQLYDTLLGRLGVTRYHLELNSIGCRDCRPAYLESLRTWLAANGGRLDDDASEDRRQPLRVFDNYLAKPRRFARRSTRRRRSANRSAPRVEHFAPSARPRRDGVAYVARSDARQGPGLLLAHDVRVHRPDGEPELDAHGGRPLRLPRRGDRRPADTRHRLRRRHRAAPDRAGGGGGVEAPAEPGIDVFLAVEEGAPRVQVAAWLAELRRAGVAAETDYAGRSLKGLLTQARRLRAERTLIVGPSSATLRSPGRQDEPVAHDAIVSRLST